MKVYNPTHRTRGGSALKAPLDVSFNIAVKTISRLCTKNEFDRTDDSSLCDTLAKCKAYFDANNKHLLIWTGASENTIFECQETNLHFRNWHDFHHVTKNLPFNTEGEKAVALLQCEDIRKVYGVNDVTDSWCKLVMCEVVGQIEYAEHNGFYVSPQNAFTLAYLENPSAAIESGAFNGEVFA